jgi:hypothetical protein
MGVTTTAVRFATMCDGLATAALLRGNVFRSSPIAGRHLG